MANYWRWITNYWRWVTNWRWMPYWRWVGSPRTIPPMASEIEVLEDTTTTATTAVAASASTAAGPEAAGAEAAAEEAAESLKDDVYTAAMFGDLEKLQRLVEAEGRPVTEPDGRGYYALQQASFNNHVAAAQYMLQHGADVNAVDHTGQTALHKSASRGHIQVAEVLLKEGAKVDAADKDGFQATHVAALHGQTKFINHIVAKWNADPDVLDNCGRSPLHWAACMGYADSIRVLLDLNAYRTRQDNKGLTPLHWAAYKGNLEACTVLVQASKKDDLMAKCKLGLTPLHWAAHVGNLKKCTVLVQAGKKDALMAKCKIGLTPAQVAVNANHWEVAVFLFKVDDGPSLSSSICFRPPSEMVDHKSELEDLEHILGDISAEPTKLSYTVLQLITNNFCKVIGYGGFAVVYQGVLPNGKKVAVKNLRIRHGFSDKEFVDEINCLRRAKHNNVVRFLGYCANGLGELMEFNGNCVIADVQKRLLCFEYVPNGSLHRYLRGKAHEDEWKIRYQMIKGICQGLHYLHETRINHLDLKPENILLDVHMEPKITDFGMSRCFEEGHTTIFTETIRGTRGYIAPEIINNGEISLKSDIFSLGIIIIKLLIGHNDYDIQKWHESLNMDCRRVRCCTEIAQACLDDDRHKRPAMGEIMHKLFENEVLRLTPDEHSALLQQEFFDDDQLARNLMHKLLDYEVLQLTPDEQSAVLQQVLRLTPEELSSLPIELQPGMIQLHKMLSAGKELSPLPIELQPGMIQFRKMLTAYIYGDEDEDGDYFYDEDDA